MSDRKRLFNIWLLKKQAEEAGIDFAPLEKGVHNLLSRFLTDEYKYDALLKDLRTAVDSEKIKWNSTIFDEFSTYLLREALQNNANIYNRIFDELNKEVDFEITNLRKLTIDNLKALKEKFNDKISWLNKTDVESIEKYILIPKIEKPALDIIYKELSKAVQKGADVKIDSFMDITWLSPDSQDKIKNEFMPNLLKSILEKERFEEFVSEIDKVQNVQTSTFDNLLYVIEKYRHAFTKQNNVNYQNISQTAIKNWLLNKIKNLNYVDVRSMCELVSHAESESVSAQVRHTILGLISQINNKFFNTEKSKYGNLPALAKLTEQQQNAVYNEEKNALIVAGAGCGKSTTILGKVAYLLASGKASADEVLLLSFTNDTADDLNQKLKTHNMPEIAQTFHKLGKGILEKINGSRVGVLDDQKTKALIMDFLNTNDTGVQDDLYRWFAYYKDSFLSFEEFGNQGDYAAYLDSLSFESIKSMLIKRKRGMNKAEKFKSEPEVLIANWLFENGIEYIYEHPYQDKAGNTVCNPDFYLPEYDIWIEHWGVMENNSVPWLKDRNKAYKYIADKEIKQANYKKDGAKVIDLHLYEFYQHALATNLKQKLIAFGVELRPLTQEQKRDVVKQLIHQRGMSSLASLMGRFLSLFKSNGYATERDLNELQGRTLQQSSEFDRKRIDVFFNLFKVFYKQYNEYLSKYNLIDFSDMIRSATGAVMSGEHLSNYKYILIDEFQDVAKDRCDLIRAIQKQTDAYCFCVGDDWQSIYRFNGGDLRFFVNFEEYFPDHKEYFIEDTFRSGQNLVDLAGDFVQKNPYQKRKKLNSHSDYQTQIKAFICPIEGCHSTGLTDIVNDIVEQIKADPKIFKKNPKIMLLIRNKSDLEIFRKESMRLDWELQGDDGKDAFLRHREHPELHFEVSTVHKAKGLQADIVIILNMGSGPLGFPNQIMDDKLLSELLVKLDRYPYAEERRLFYVALTRAQKICYLVVPAKNPSLFWNEISTSEYIKEFGAGRKIRKCPKCSGYLIYHKSQYGKDFYGCSNYKPGNYTSCDYKELAEQSEKTVQEIEQNKEQVCRKSCDNYVSWDEFLKELY